MFLFFMTKSKLFACRLSPVGVASVIMSKILSVTELGSVMSTLSLFILTCVIGIMLYQIVFQNLLYLLIVRKNPFKFYFNLLEPWVTAFATASTWVYIQERFFTWILNILDFMFRSRIELLLRINNILLNLTTSIPILDLMFQSYRLYILELVFRASKLKYFGFNFRSNKIYYFGSHILYRIYLL